MLLAILFYFVCLPLATADECSTALVCSVINYQRMHTDGTLQKLPKRSFGFRLDGKILVTQKGGSPLGDGTLNFEIHNRSLCGIDGRLIQNQSTKNVQFEGDNGLYSFEYINGRMLISSHVHHDFFDLSAAQCDEL